MTYEEGFNLIWGFAWEMYAYGFATCFILFEGIPWVVQRVTKEVDE